MHKREKHLDNSTVLETGPMRRERDSNIDHGVGTTGQRTGADPAGKIPERFEAFNLRLDPKGFRI